MNKQTKEELIKALEALDTQLERVINTPLLLDEPEDSESRDILINQITELTNKLSKL
jgi:hypothetical protein